MTTWQLWTSAWEWEPSVVIGCALLVLSYLAVVRFRVNKQAWLFMAGVLVLLFALVSPLDPLGDAYLFSAHMLQHLLLILIVPPLLLLGLPRAVAEQALSRAPLRKIEQVLRKPVLAWFLGIFTLYVWHLPALYNAALANEGIHILEHELFLVTAAILWWPILAPLRESRLAPLPAILYLFAAGAANGILGIVLTLTPPGLYPLYVHPFDRLGILPLIRDGWGVTPAVDQQLGGLLMWVPGSVVFLIFILAELARWYREPQEEALAVLQNPARPGLVQE